MYPASCKSVLQGLMLFKRLAVQMRDVTDRMLETALRRSAGCRLAAVRLRLAFDGSTASVNQMADIHQLFSPASGEAHVVQCTCISEILQGEVLTS